VFRAALFIALVATDNDANTAANPAMMVAQYASTLHSLETISKNTTARTEVYDRNEARRYAVVVPKSKIINGVNNVAVYNK
jgi:hypothetical protein